MGRKTTIFVIAFGFASLGGAAFAVAASLPGVSEFSLAAAAKKASDRSEFLGQPHDAPFEAAGRDLPHPGGDAFRNGGARQGRGASPEGGFRIVFDQGPFAGAPGAVMVGRVGAALATHGSVGVTVPLEPGFGVFGEDGEGDMPGDPGAFMGERDAAAIRYVFQSSDFDLSASLEPGGRDDDFAGFGRGGEAGLDGDVEDRGDRPASIWDGRIGVGASYRRALVELDLRLGGGFQFQRQAARYHLGAEAGYAGFSLAGFLDRRDGEAGAAGDLYGFGAAYRSGSFAFSGGYVRTGASGLAQEEDFVHIGGGLSLAPGVSAFASAQYGEEADGSGYGAFAGLGLRF